MQSYPTISKSLSIVIFLLIQNFPKIIYSVNSFKWLLILFLLPTKFPGKIVNNIPKKYAKQLQVHSQLHPPPLQNWDGHQSKPLLADGSKGLWCCWMVNLCRVSSVEQGDRSSLSELRVSPFINRFLLLILQSIG